MTIVTRRFKYRGEVYEEGTQADLGLRDLMLLEAETKDLGWLLHMGEIVRLAETFGELTPDQAKVHPEAAKMLAVTIWLAMVKHSRDRGILTPVPFSDVLDANLAEFEFIEAPKAPSDHATPRRPRPAKKAAAGAAAKRASARSRKA